MLLCGCVGGGSSQTPPSSAIGVNTEQLYSKLVIAPNQLYAGFAIDSDSPVIPSFADETALRGFLAKQPAISEFNQLANQTEYVSGAWIKGDDANISLIDSDFKLVESRKYFLLGVSERKPATTSKSELSYEGQLAVCWISHRKIS